MNPSNRTARRALPALLFVALTACAADAPEPTETSGAAIGIGAGSGAGSGSLSCSGSLPGEAPEVPSPGDEGGLPPLAAADAGTGSGADAGSGSGSGSGAGSGSGGAEAFSDELEEAFAEAPVELGIAPRDRPRAPVCRPGCESKRPYRRALGALFSRSAVVGDPCTVSCVCGNAPNGDRCQASQATGRGKVRESYGVKWCDGQCAGSCRRR